MDALSSNPAWPIPLTAGTALLLEAGADPTVADQNGDTAISMAKRGGHEGVVQILGRRGAGGYIGGRDIFAPQRGGGLSVHHE
jgi:ankyrin repeat protein